MTPGFRKFALTTHVSVSVGWIGAVAAFLALSIAGLTSREADVVRGAYVAMNLISLYVIIPLCLAALATGLIESLGKQWGLLRHYWVVVKLLLTVLATGLLLMHQYTSVSVAAVRVLGAAAGTLPSAGRLATQLVVEASLAILVLVTATALSVYKPEGLTSYGRRKLQERSPLPRQLSTATIRNRTSLGLKILLATVGVISAAVVVMHLTGLAGSHHGH